MTKPQDMQVFEILEELNACTTKQRKVDLIRTKYSNHTPLQYVLRWNFDKSIQSMLPEGEPPFDKEDKDGDSPQNLWSYLKLFPSFVNSAQGKQLPELKRENLFIEMLQALDLQEAEMICHAKDGNLSEISDITEDVVNAAYPDMGLVAEDIPEPTAEEQKEDLLAQVKALKEEAKGLNSLAKELADKAKAI
jgi:hypothetical protein|tara:strand:+ start:27110 stop:27685 length:576 start_codon:yes stop_codon:yes gene_type:complete